MIRYLNRLNSRWLLGSAVLQPGARFSRHLARGPLERSSPAEIVRQVARRDAVETPHPALQPAVVGVHVLDVEGALADADAGREVERLVVQPVPGGEGGVGLGAVRAQHGTASPATTGPSAAAMASAPRSGSTASAVWPARSRAISAGTCSAESPRRLARSPRRCGPRPGGASPRRHRREPLWERRKKVSSASTTPPRASRAAAGARRKRCRQRKLVVRCTPQWAAALARLMPAASASP